MNNTSVFRSIITDLQKREEFQLAYQLQRDLMIAEINERKEREQLKQDIIKDVMANISVTYNKTAIDDLSKAIKNLVR